MRSRRGDRLTELLDHAGLNPDTALPLGTGLEIVDGDRLPAKDERTAIGVGKPPRQGRPRYAQPPGGLSSCEEIVVHRALYPENIRAVAFPEKAGPTGAYRAGRRGKEGFPPRSIPVHTEWVNRPSPCTCEPFLERSPEATTWESPIPAFLV